MADRKGRLEDRPERIEAEIFPFKFQKVNVKKCLDDLANNHEQFIVRYQKYGQRYIQVVNFLDHQYPHIREAESTIPAPYKHHANTNLDRLTPDSGVTESPILNPESLLPRGAFESVWGLYPRKLGKDAALRFFKSQVQTPQEFSDIQKALSNFITDLRKKGTTEEYIPHGSTWFNKRWRDWIGYAGATLPPQKAAPVFRKAEVLPPDPTASDIKEMHDDKVKMLGICRLQDCAFCAKVEA